MKKLNRILTLLIVSLMLILGITACGVQTPAPAAASTSQTAAASVSQYDWSDKVTSVSSIETNTNTADSTEQGAQIEEDQTEEQNEIALTEDAQTEETETDEEQQADAALTVSEDGTYSSKDEVALYIHLYGHLPSNYISKYDAEDLGWDNKQGNLWDVAPGMSIGGNKFGNYEGLLPKAKGRKYYECDIDYTGGYRGAKRIIYSNDGLVYYTEDHYESFEQLY